MLTDAPHRESLVLPRFLALILFAGSLLFGLGTVGAVGAAFSGDRRALWMLPVVGLTAWMLGWLGMVLWSGRMIPRWFIVVFGLALVGGPIVGVMLNGTWTELLTVIGMIVPSALGCRDVLRNYPGKPKALEEI